MPVGRTTRALLVASAALAGCTLTAPGASAATRYVFSCFLDSAEKLSIYSSSNGLDFTLLDATGYAGPTGVLRDPTIMKHTDGKYYIAYTLQSWTTSSKSFGIASSTNLLDWTFLVEVPAGVANVADTWAPEWFKDTDGVHLIVNIDTSDTDFRAFDFRAQDDTLKNWDAPVTIGIGPNNIDTFVVKVDATYHAFSKNETTKYIEHATAPAFHGPWTWVGKDNWAGWGSGKEGIALFQLDDGSWRMFLDCYSGCGYLYADSADLMTWSGTKTVPGGLSGVVRHGTVLREEMGLGGMGLGGAGAGGRANAGAGGRAPGQGGLGASGASAGSTSTAGASAGGRVGTSGAGGDGAGNGAAGVNGGVTGGAGGGTAGTSTSSAGTTASAAAGMSAQGGSGGSGGAPTLPSAGSGAGSSAGPASTGPSEGNETPGCGCSVPGEGAGAPWASALGLVLLAVRRRTRRTA